MLAVGVSIIARYNSVYNFIIDKIRKHPDPVNLLMAIIVDATSEQIDGPQAAPDSFLGLSSDIDTGVIMKPSYALLLLRILWCDRKRFLIAMAYSHPPPLNGLLLIFWRSVRRFSTPALWAAFSDIYWRTCLAAESRDVFALKRLGLDAWDGKDRDTIVDLEDARSVLIILAGRMTPGSILYRAPGSSPLIHMVPYAIPALELRLGTEDLFIPAIRALFNYFWSSRALSVGIKHPGVDVIILTPIIYMLKHLLRHTHDAGGFLNATAELGFIEAIAQGIVLVEEQSETKKDTPWSRSLLGVCQTYIESLLSMEPSTYRKAFAGSFVEWFKTLRYLRSHILDTHTQDKPSTIERGWLELGDLFGYNTQVERAEGLTHRCTYTRCPDPVPVNSSWFRCPCGKRAVYCGIRCQQADWVMDCLPASHRHTCIWQNTCVFSLVAM